MIHYSVKKPFTVVVAVIAILIIGVVAYMGMGIDLLPEMELPYVVVMTTYVGASPEEVELTVTKPLEASLALLSGVKNLSSISAENYSMIALEFSQGTNMDGAMIELSSYVDMVKGTFPDEVAAPTVLRINPSMMPVMIMTADKDGMDEVEFSAYVEDTLVPALERINGVASVTTMGVISEQVSINWDEAAVDALNDKILKEVDSELAEAKAELDKAKREIEDGKAELEEESDKAYEELAEAAGELSNGQLQLNMAQNALDAAPDELEAARTELENTQAQLEGMLDLLDAQEEINDYIEELETTLDQLDAAEAQILDQYGSYGAAKRSMEEMYAGMETAKSAIDQTYAAYQLAQASGDPAQIGMAAAMLDQTLQAVVSADTSGMLALPPNYDPADPAPAAQMLSGALGGAMAQVQQGMADLDALRSGKKEAEAAYQELLLQRTKLETVLMQTGGMTEDDIYDALDQIEEGLEEIEKAEKDLPGQQLELDDAKQELEEGQLELEKGKLTLSTELSSAAVQLALAEAQIETAYDEFEEAREEAFKNAGLDGVLTPELLSSILMASNFSMPAGYLDENGESTLVKVGNKFTGVEELSGLLLMDLNLETVGPVYLSDIAEVVMTNDAGSYYARVNGNPGIILSLSKQSMFSTAEVSESINEQMQKMMEEDSGLHLTGLSDQGFYIRTAVGAVMDNLLLGAVLAIIILVLFLRDIRPTLIISLSIPISLMLAVGLMYFSGVNINVISLAGLAMGVGMLVDNSIVVIENIMRLRGLGVPAKEAAITGAKQIAGAITASTLTTVCVFLPIVFTHGLARQLFTDMGLTVAYSLLASLLVALTLIPTMAAGMLKKEQKPAGRFHQKVMAFYGNAITFCLRRKWVVLLPVLAIAVFCVVMIASMGTALMPTVDYGQLQITIAAGDTYEYTEEELKAIADDVTEDILTIDGIAMVSAFEGSLMGSMGLGGDEEYMLTLFVLCDVEQGLSGKEARAQIEPMVEDVAAEIVISEAAVDMTALTSSGIQVEIRSDDTDAMAEMAARVAAVMETVPGLTEIEAGLDAMAEEIRIVVDKNEAMEHGMTVAQIYQLVAAELTTETNSMTLSGGGKDYPVVIVDAPENSMTQEKLADFSFKVEKTDSTGKVTEETVYLTDVAAIQYAEAFSSIQRLNQTRVHTVSAAVDDGYNIGLVSKDLDAALADVEILPGCSITVTGENETIEEAMTDLLLMILLACVLIYLIMVAQFQNLLLPFIVLLTIPLAFSGGMLTLIMIGMEVSIVAMLGFLVLSGVIVNNGIVFVDCVNQLRGEQGMEKREALKQAGLMRLRPILMTALTTIGSMFAMVFSQQMGAELIRPMAVVAVGGLVYATFMTLVFVPVMYDLVIRNKGDRKRGKKQPAAPEMPADTPVTMEQITV